jgi:hypothetical protein
LGAVAILLFAYIVLCHFGFVAWVFPGEEFDLSEPAALVASASLYVCLGALLLWLGRVKAWIDDEELIYRGVFRTAIIRWSDVARIEIKLGKLRGLRRSWKTVDEVRVHSRTTTVRVRPFFTRQIQLTADIIAMARAHSPNVVIEGDTSCLGRERRDGEQG